MNYTQASQKDVPILEEIIKREFPYTDYDAKKISSKLFDDKYFIITARQKNIFVGFAEAEFFENEARLNAIYIEDAWRGQKISKKLIHKIIHECKRRRVHRIFLLVRKQNLAAKGLYEKTGFIFEKIYEKEIHDSIIEVWQYHIN
jgi:ribosomal protein S18 acetylase RimI-like enzyme